MKSVVFVLFAVLLCSAVSAELTSVYIFNIITDEGKLYLKDVYLDEVYYNTPKSEGAYSGKLLASDGRILHVVYFDFPSLEVSDSDPSWFDKAGKQIYFPNESSIRVVSKSLIQLQVPRFPDAAFFVVYDPKGIEQLRVNVAFLSRCDGVCTEGDSCQSDCDAMSGLFCGDGVCERSEAGSCSTNCAENTEHNKSFIVFAGFGIVLGVIVLLAAFMFRRRNQ